MTNRNQNVSVYSFLVRVIVPLIMVVIAITAGAGISNVLLTTNIRFLNLLVAVIVGIGVYAILLPLYYVIFLREK